MPLAYILAAVILIQSLSPLLQWPAITAFLRSNAILFGLFCVCVAILWLLWTSRRTKKQS